VIKRRTKSRRRRTELMFQVAMRNGIRTQGKSPASGRV
jgi:hypothetical protein